MPLYTAQELNFLIIFCMFCKDSINLNFSYAFILSFLS